LPAADTGKRSFTHGAPLAHNSLYENTHAHGDAHADANAQPHADARSVKPVGHLRPDFAISRLRGYGQPVR